jgi:integrase
MELALLRRAFNLTVRAGLLPQRPLFPTITVRNARSGFLEAGDLQAVVAHLPAEVAAVVAFMAATGWRRSEVLSLQWRNVDLGAGVVRLDAGTTKTGEGRVFPFRALPRLAELLQLQRERTSAVEQAQGAIVPSVFHRDGAPIRDFRIAWRRACDAAGVPGRIPHDLRRSFARDASRAGVPEAVIMQLAGWRTRSIFDRYRITNEADLADGLARMAQAQGTAPEPRKVARLRRTSTVLAQSGRRSARGD